MKAFLSSVFGFVWMTIISVGVAYLLMWILPYCFYSAWWKVIFLVLFGTAIFNSVWNAIIPYLAICPVAYISSKADDWKYTMIFAALPSVFVGIYCLYRFWFVLAPNVPFDGKDWVSSIVWSYVVLSCFYHLSKGVLSMMRNKEILSSSRRNNMTDTRFKWLATCATVAVISIAGMIIFAGTPKKPSRQAKEHKPTIEQYYLIDRMGIVHADRKCRRLNYKGVTSRRIHIDEIKYQDRVSFCPNCVDDDTYNLIMEY